MKIQTTLSPQLQQQMKLAPQVIQSIEILQLPIMALIEHVQQELTDNPVLEELVQPERDGKDTAQDEGAENKEEPQDDEFKKLREMADEWRDYFSQTTTRRSSSADERDQKQEALENTAAKSMSLQDYLLGQLSIMELDDSGRTCKYGKSK
jgi:RNA polymerase sigma-54 factor